MSVVLKQIMMLNEPFITSKAPHTFNEDLVCRLKVIKSDVLMDIDLVIKKGFMTDGASVPFIFTWFLPKWDKNNILYNVGAAIHDGLYIHKGFNLFSREECDDILRSIWRQAGISRFKAGVADKCIEWLAGCSCHWGNDSDKVGDLFTMEF